MPALPRYDPVTNACDSPHVVILGAGASRAACPDGDAEGRRLPLMNDLVEVLDLEPVLSGAGVQYSGENFEALYGSLVTDPSRDAVVKEIEGRIREYFSSLRLPERVTLYDELLLSLRPKDLIASFNWDPFLLQAYSRNREIGELPRIVFLHGNVWAGYCPEHNRKGYATQRCGHCDQPLQPTPLLYPVQQKNYTENPFISNEWNELHWRLSHAYILTIFGYSAPTSDVEARKLILEVWQRNPLRDLADIEIIDIKAREDVEATWRDLLSTKYYRVLSSLDHSCLLRYPRRTFEALAMASLQNDPCRDNRLPRLREVEKLQEHIWPLVEAEIALREENRPFKCR